MSDTGFGRGKTQTKSTFYVYCDETYQALSTALESVHMPSAEHI